MIPTTVVDRKLFAAERADAIDPATLDLYRIVGELFGRLTVLCGPGVVTLVTVPGEPFAVVIRWMQVVSGRRYSRLQHFASMELRMMYHELGPACLAEWLTELELARNVAASTEGPLP